MTHLGPAQGIETVRSALPTALPACIAGSAVACETYGLDGYTDVDVFCFTGEATVLAAATLQNNGFQLEDRHTRVWARWLKYGIGRWHTNSLKLIGPDNIEANLIFKKAGGNPLTSLSQVLESFDFGLLGTGYDLETGRKLDLRGYMFPDYDIDGPLPLMPERRDAWRSGFLSKYQGLRELGRYAKYVQRGFDLSLVADDLITGYMAAALYNGQRDDAERQHLSKIYYRCAEMIEDGDIQEMIEAGKSMLELDELDEIMEALE